MLVGIEMERRARELLDTLSIRIGDVRVPVAALSGAQRQAVAIARSVTVTVATIRK